MLSFLPSPIIGIISIFLIIVNSIFWMIPGYPVVLFKVIIPIKRWHRICYPIMHNIIWLWLDCMHLIYRFTKKITWDISGIDDLKLNGSYLIFPNHQTWLDVIVLQQTFHRKISFQAYFLKKELIWVPIFGLAWWALDLPLMRRYSEAKLKKHPHLKGKDLEITKKACEKFKGMPISIINFVEGTRFTPEKHIKQRSPYKNLLKPKAGGIAYVLSAMGEQIHKILDVNISYPQGIKGLWAFNCGKIKEIKVRIQSLSVTKDLLGDYNNDNQYKERIKDWLNIFWAEKDKQLEILFNENCANNT